MILSFTWILTKKNLTPIFYTQNSFNMEKLVSFHFWTHLSKLLAGR